VVVSVGRRRSPKFIAALAWRTAPDRVLLGPYYDQLLDQIPDGRDADFPLRRHDEY
jgi:hypothetical protein